jgi:drug/metabolite transporter superfamily protein YnfA
MSQALHKEATGRNFTAYPTMYVGHSIALVICTDDLKSKHKEQSVHYIS